MSKPFAFVWLLGKRLLRRPGFLVLLALIPLLTLGYAAGTKGDAGVVTVALARDDQADPLAKATMEALPESSELIRFVLCDSRAEAADKVRYGKADCAWVFHAGMEENVKKFLRTRSAKDAFVTVYQREEMPLLTLARERLNMSVYEAMVRQLYLARLPEESQAMAQLSEQEKLAFWENTQIPGELFAYTQVDGYSQPESHLASPVRGLLAAIVLLGGLGSSMYHKRDEQSGTFRYLPYRLAWLPELVGGLWACLALSLAAVAALAVTGMGVAWYKELLCALGLALACVCFSMALSRLLKPLSALAGALPVVTVAALVCSPVFLTLNPLKPVSYLMPLSHYLWAITDFSRLGWLAVYSAVCFALARIPRGKG